MKQLAQNYKISLKALAEQKRKTAAAKEKSLTKINKTKGKYKGNHDLILNIIDEIQADKCTLLRGLKRKNPPTLALFYKIKPLHLAIANQKPRALEWLLEVINKFPEFINTNPNNPPNAGITPAMYLAANNQELTLWEIYEILLTHNPDKSPTLKPEHNFFIAQDHAGNLPLLMITTPSPL